MNTLYQLFRPWAYLRIASPKKHIFDWWVPLAFTFASLGCLFLAESRINFFGPGGFVSLVTGFVQNLPGFFMAALAAVATFNRSDLDQLMAEPAPVLPTRIRGLMKEVQLTRRRFLCVLFAFLTAQSVVVTLGGVMGITGASWIGSLASGYARIFLYYGGAMLYLLALWQMVSVTLMGLYYLGERIHQAE